MRQLQRDLALQAAVGAAGVPDLAHAADAERRKQLVGTDALADREAVAVIVLHARRTRGPRGGDRTLGTQRGLQMRAQVLVGRGQGLEPAGARAFVERKQGVEQRREARPVLGG